MDRVEKRHRSLCDSVTEEMRTAIVILPLDRARDALALSQSGEAMQVALDPRLRTNDRTSTQQEGSS